MSLQDQILEAQKRVRKLKKASPYIFPEYSRLLNARSALRTAKADLESAQRVWDKLGEPYEVSAPHPKEK